MECPREGIDGQARVVLMVTCPADGHLQDINYSKSEIYMFVPCRVEMPRILSHDSPQLMPCIKSGIKDHVVMQSIQDVDMLYPEKPPFTYKQTAEERMEETCLRMMRVMFGGPSRLDNQDRRKTNQEHDFTCVKSSWNQFCKVPGKALNIEDVLFNMNKAICEAYLLANFHVMRMQRAQALG